MDDIGASSYYRFIGGDNRGFEDIVRTYRDGLILFILQYVEDIGAAEDISQDVFFKLFVKRPHYSKKALFKTWLYTIGKHEAFNYLKKHRSILPEAATLAKDADYTEFLNEIFVDERKIKLHQALGELKNDYRTVLYLVYFEDLTPREISDLLGKTPKQISDLLYHAKSSLHAVIMSGVFIAK
jgi:RNA polymerase sigma factor (sigma-70 family)